MTSIESLPNEVMLLIFMQLYPCSLLNAAGVCTKWYALARHGACWQRHWTRLRRELPSAEYIYQALMRAASRNPDTFLCRAYCKAFLIQPRTVKGAEHRLKFQVLSMLRVPHAAEVDIIRSAHEGHARWSFDITVSSVASVVVHKHRDSGVLCTPRVMLADEYEYHCTPLNELAWRGWNRFYTLTRGEDSQLVAETRPWITFEARAQ